MQFASLFYGLGMDVILEVGMAGIGRKCTSFKKLPMTALGFFDNRI